MIAQSRWMGACLVVAALTARCAGPDPEPAPAGRSSSATSLPARWWAWAASTPTDRNPVQDTTGQWCDQAQPGDVWFLAGTFGEQGVQRDCHTPPGRPIYFPVINLMCPVAPGQAARSAERDCVIATRTARATLDGRELVSTEATSGGAFTLKPVPGSPLADSAGRSVAWGRWIGPLRLEPGPHTLRIEAVADKFAVEVTYTLTAE